jgi:hypothetical protein
MQFDVKWSRVESGSEIPGRRVEKKNLKCRGHEEGKKKSRQDCKKPESMELVVKSLVFDS